MQFSNENALGKSLFTKLKTSTPKELKGGIVYRIPYSDYDKVYIGQTKRYFKTRISEHKTSIRPEIW